MAGELSKSSPVNIIVNTNWNASNRQIHATVELHYTANMSADTESISLMITENNIIAPQLLTTGSVDTFYTHQHILRTMLTPSLGQRINETKTAGRVVVLKYVSDPMPANWNENNLNLIAFVHHSGQSNEVLQVAEKKVN